MKPVNDSVAEHALALAPYELRLGCPDVRRGFAPPSTLCRMRAVPFVRAIPQMWAGRTRGVASNQAKTHAAGHSPASHRGGQAASHKAAEPVR